MSALKLGIPDGYDRYEVALTAIQRYIEKQVDLKQFSSKESILEKMIEHLLNELKLIANLEQQNISSNSP
jgi:hypothetical protein